MYFYFIGGLNLIDRTYIAIDLKSFYASVECRERGLDPLTTNLVVADKGRTEKTICLAVTPSLKAWGIKGRARLFEVVQKVREANEIRRLNIPNHTFTGASFDDVELKNNPTLELDYIVAPPRMAFYMEYSSRIYNVYLKYFSPDDIVVYSIDEVFIDATHYLKTYNMSARALAMTVIQDVLGSTGITATAGIGTNLFLAKIAMDIMAKHIPPDKDGVRIAEVNEEIYRRELWSHTPITDFWRVGKGYAKKLAEYGIYTMGDVARCSVGKPNDVLNEDLLYKLFGVNAELLIDHAWGWEPCTIDEIKKYRPESKSICLGQVLQSPYSFEQTRLVVKEMTESLALDLVEKKLVTDQINLTIGYDIENLTNPQLRINYSGEIKKDAYGRNIPKHAHGTGNLDSYTSSAILIMKVMLSLFDKIVNPSLLVRRITITANHLINENEAKKKTQYEQMNFFSNYENIVENEKEKNSILEKERKMQEAMISIKRKYGKNAILKGINLQDGAMEKSRNEKIGGHKA